MRSHDEQLIVTLQKNPRRYTSFNLLVEIVDYLACCAATQDEQARSVKLYGHGAPGVLVLRNRKANNAEVTTRAGNECSNASIYEGKFNVD